MGLCYARADKLLSHEALRCLITRGCFINREMKGRDRETTQDTRLADLRAKMVGRGVSQRQNRIRERALVYRVAGLSAIMYIASLSSPADHRFSFPVNTQ